MARSSIIGILTALAVLTLSTAQAAEPKTFRDCADCPEMVVVPAGASFIGSPQSVTQREGVPAKRAKRERPVHRIRIAQAFAIGKFEVTRRQYGLFVSATGYRKPGGCKYWTGDKFETADSKNWQDPGYEQGDRHPAVCISWDDAKAFTNWIAGKNRSTRAMMVIGPAIGRLTNTMASPPEINRDWRSAGSAMGPSTIANTAGATG